MIIGIDPATDGNTVLCLIDTSTPKMETYSYKRLSVSKDDIAVVLYDDAERIRQVRRKLGNAR